MNTAKLLGVGYLVALATALTTNQPRQAEEAAYVLSALALLTVGTLSLVAVACALSVLRTENTRNVRTTRLLLAIAFDIFFRQNRSHAEGQLTTLTAVTYRHDERRSHMRTEETYRPGPRRIAVRLLQRVNRSAYYHTRHLHPPDCWPSIIMAELDRT